MNHLRTYPLAIPPPPVRHSASRVGLKEISQIVNDSAILGSDTLALRGHPMKMNKLVLAGAAAVVALASWTLRAAADTDNVGSKKIKHVLLLSIDGMHAVDFYNCAHGIAGANGGDPYCPNLAALGHTAINYVGATSSKPSDSFPGMAALVTGRLAQDDRPLLRRGL